MERWFSVCCSRRRPELGFPVPTSRKLTNVTNAFNSSTRGYNTLFRSPRAPALTCTYTQTHTCTHSSGVHGHLRSCAHTYTDTHILRIIENKPCDTMWFCLFWTIKKDLNRRGKLCVNGTGSNKTWVVWVVNSPEALVITGLSFPQN